MAKSDLFLAFNEITETHHLPREVVIEALQQALVSAYRRDSGISAAQKIDAEVDPNTSKYTILVEKEVVEEALNPRTEIILSAALELQPTCVLGDTVMAPEETNTRSFGRIAAQTAKQVILQKIREAERKTIYDEYKDREGDLISGQVQSVNNQHITIGLGRAEAIMPANQQIRGEKYHTHERIRAYVMEVKETNRGPSIIVSRAHKNMLRRLLEYEVPEIYNGQVEIKNIAREAGHRSKVAVAALQPGVDPVGACVGIKGTRIQNIVKELKDEKIDVIEWSTDAAIFIAKALSPARVTGVYLEEDLDNGNTATVIVPDEQLSLAIGREGQNARLAAKLTGWRVDIKNISDAAQSAITRLEEEPLSKLSTDHPELVDEVRRIMDKKALGKPVQPEEYTTLGRFVQLAEQRQLDAREQVRSKRKKAMDKVRPTVPAFAFAMPISELELARDIEDALKHLPNVGELMVRLLVDETQLHQQLQAARAGTDAMDAIKEAIDSLVLAREEELSALPLPIDEAEAVLDQSMEVAAGVVAGVAADGDVAAPVLGVPVAEDEIVPPAFVDDGVNESSRSKKFAERFQKTSSLQQRTQPSKVEPRAAAPEDRAAVAVDEDGSKKGKKKGDKSRALVFDEKRGEVVAKRKRRGNRTGEWGEDEF